MARSPTQKKVYRSAKATSKKAGKTSCKEKKKCCKWLLANTCIANDYRMSHCVNCNNCKIPSKKLFLIHLDDDELGDYICSICDKDIDLRYYCLKCKTAHYPESDDEL